MGHRVLRYKNSDISYYRYGLGPQPVICFHGYGETGEVYGFLEALAGKEFSFYSIELPFHGKTSWNEKEGFSHHDLSAIINSICDEKDKLLIMGFSLGGRVALSLLQVIPMSTKKLVLLAPDGLKVNFWYWLAARTWAGNRLFRFTMKKPGWFFGLLKIMNKLKLVNASVFKFVNYYIGDSVARQLLYDRWTSLKALKPNLTKIKQQIRASHIPARLIYGKHDRIILASVGERFRNGIEEYCTITVLTAGHQVLHENYGDHIVDALQR
jgi:pimeloyl-ACP methyl ester carboxylesterase